METRTGPVFRRACKFDAFSAWLETVFANRRYIEHVSVRLRARAELAGLLYERSRVDKRVNSDFGPKKNLSRR